MADQEEQAAASSPAPQAQEDGSPSQDVEQAAPAGEQLPVTTEALPQAEEAPKKTDTPPQTEEAPQKTETPPQTAEAPPTKVETPPQTAESPPQKVETPPQTAEPPPQKVETPPQTAEAPPQTAEAPPPTAEAPPPTAEAPPPTAEAPPSPAEAAHPTFEAPGSPPPQHSPQVPPPPPEPFLQKPAEDFLKAEAPTANALQLTWSFGMNKNVPVLNLTDGKRKMIFYVCAHTGVLYDLETNSQQLLQGHSNAISCTCVSEDKRWIVTADKGKDSMVIIWDSETGIPVRTIFDAGPEDGIEAVAMTPDAKYLATLSSGDAQALAIWDWTVEGDVPVCTAELNESYGVQNFILFNPEDTSQIVTNSDCQVVFYSWKGGSLEFFAPPLSDDDFNKPVGKYSQSIFLSNSTRCLTATSIGNLVVWDTNKPLTKVVSSEATPDKKALKLVKLQERGINVLTTTEGYIVAGDVLGHVKFFDQTLKLMNWYQDFHLGPINSLSFAYEQEFLDEDEQLQIQIGLIPQERPKKDGDFPPDATIAAKQFVLRDFVIGTSNALYAHVTTDGTDVKVIHRDHDAAVHALASHPNMSRLVVGGYSGLLKLWDYETKQVVASRWFEKGQLIRCCSFNPDGHYLAVGFMNGSVRVLDGLTLSDALEEPFRYSRDAITHVAFSHDSQYLATADAEFTVSVFEHQLGVPGAPYVYLGRHRAHYKLIVDLMFGIQLDVDKPRLLSLAEDRVLVEYDLESSSKDDLRVLSLDRIEQSATPLCMTWYPPITKESFILTANDQFKCKLYNSTTKMCRKTLLGPTFGSPVIKFAILPAAEEAEKRYMAYITEDKVGLHILPLDGNPHNAMALVAHPQGVSNVAASHDGKYVFTAGGGDCTVHMWTVNVMVLEAQAKLGGEDLVPFYGLMEGGRDGELFKELEDYFYYAQIRSQGVDTMEVRKVSTTIALSEVPYVMRALGFYPSEQEIQDMLNEVKFSTYVETGSYKSEIDLGEFIKLYINHRPAFGLQEEKVRWAFEQLGFPTQDGPTIERAELLDLLQTNGEHMTEYELAEYLTTLLGFNMEGGSSELHGFDPTMAGDIIEENLPVDISSKMFSNELLGFGASLESSEFESSQELAQLQTLSSSQEQVS